MPSIIQGYEYDIFISYRQKDNKQDGWVTEFINSLKNEIDATFKEDISIYFDENPHDGLHEHHEVDDSLREKLKCLIFIPIVSQTYCDPKCFAWEHEFKVFVEQASNDQFGLKTKLSGGNVSSRVLPVKIHDLDSEDLQLFESEVGGVMRSIDFIYSAAGVNRPLRDKEEHPDDNINRTIYRDQINKVANAIKEIIVSLKDGEPVGDIKEDTESVTQDSSEPKSLETKPKSKSKILFAAIGIALAILAGWWFWPMFNKSETAISQSLVESRIAIIPYENKTNDPELDVLGDMAADWIIKGLMNFEELKLVSYQNVKDHIEYASLGNWKSFSKQTGAEKIIKGSFYQQGDQLIFQSQIIDAVSGDIEFALPEIKGSKSNVEKIVNDLKQRIMTLVAIGIESDQTNDLLFQSSPPTFDAYQNYIKSWEYFGVEYRECRKYLNKAIALDSSFFWPYTDYVFSYLNVGNYAKGDSIFQLIDLRFDKLTPYQNLWYDYLKETIYGNLKTSLTAIKKIYEKDPKGLVTNNDMGGRLLMFNKPNEATKVYEQIDYNSYRFINIFSVWRFSAHAYVLIRMNKLVEAQEVLKYVPKENATLRTYNLKSYLYILLGQQDSIHHMITKMEEDNLPWDQITGVHNNTSWFYSLQGDKENQLKWAELSLERIKKQSKFTPVAPRIEAFANYLAEKYKEALPLYQDLANTQVNNWGNLSRIGIIYAKMNNRESVEDVIQELKTNDGPTRNGSYKYALARIYSALDEKELATEYMKQAFNEGFGFSMGRYDYDNEFVPLHVYPAYEEFVKPKG